MITSHKLAIRPFTRKLSSQRITPPGSKSITNRALMLAALCNDEITLEGALISRDTVIMCEALKKLGFKVYDDADNKRITVHGLNGFIPADEAEINVGNAGTAARFLTAMLALKPFGKYHIDCDDAMKQRPMKGLADALEKIDAAHFKYHGNEGALPFTLESNGLKGGKLNVNASESSQILSALLMISPFAQSPLEIITEGETVSKPFVEMTLKMMQQFSFNDALPSNTSHHYNVSSKTHHPYKADLPIRKTTYHVEPDATAASYFLALPLAVGGRIEVTLPKLSLQGDTAFITVLENHGISTERLGGMCAVRRASDDPRKGIDANFNDFSDTFLTLAALAPLLDSPTRISGIAHTRKQETDRVSAMATELKKLGQEVIEKEDSLEIHPRPLKPAAIETYEDHRVAMSFGILGCHDLHGNGEPWLEILDPNCCNKTFPEFFNVLEQIRKDAHD